MEEISFVSLVAYSPKVSDSALTMGVTASETRQGGSQHVTAYVYVYKCNIWKFYFIISNIVLVNLSSKLVKNKYSFLKSILWESTQESQFWGNRN